IVNERMDDGSSPPISLVQPFIYFGKKFNQIYVNNNGYLTFDQAWNSYTPYQFSANAGKNIIAPFWTDINNQINGVISYRQYTSGSVLIQATQDINQYFPQLKFRSTWVFVATWDRVAYFATTGGVRKCSKTYGYQENCRFSINCQQSIKNKTINKCLKSYYSEHSVLYGDIKSSFIFCVSGPFYPFGVGDIMSDGRSPAVSLVQPFLFFGKTYSQTYINENGYLTFDNVWDSCVSYPFPRHGVPDIIAPFWTCIFRGRGVISYRQYTSGSVLTQATQDIYQYFAQLRFRATWVFVTTWARVAYYPNSGTEPSFQVVLISDGHLSFILMNYGQIAPTSMLVQVSTIWE
uniref:NIDO domain-containing protein n=1 Tax=Electrophorus electricus TaxID=8005 RepID=A0AAY5EK99_ELEEL